MNYCKDIILYDTDDGSYSHAVSVGIPKGSVLGPILWNALYDAVLKLRLPTGAQIFRFADDIAP